MNDHDRQQEVPPSVAPQWRRWRFWGDIFLHLAALACLVLMFWGGLGYYSPRSLGHLWNLGHIITFALWAYLLLREFPFPRTLSFVGRRGLVVILCLVLAGGTEFLQGFTDRTPDWNDVGRDMVGCLFALAYLDFGAKMETRGVLWCYRLLKMVTASVLILAFIPFVFALIDEMAAARAFPLLADFESPLETDRWTALLPVSRVRGMARHGDYALRIPFATGAYSGISMKHFKRDWRGYHYLRFSVYNGDQAELELHFRLHDEQHHLSGQKYRDRFNLKFQAHQGWNDIEIDLTEVARAPADRAMDMARVQSFGLFVAKLPVPRTAYLDFVRLER